jgi:phosphatidylserine/phosphatidylglycerophosphate/cardiolipin synthase-like enzyme
MKRFRPFLIITFVLAFSINAFSQISIISARLKAAGTVVTVKGIITASEFGSLKYIQDNTGGLALYDSNVAALKRGDSVLVTGTVKAYYGDLEISPVSSFTVLNPGNTVPDPKVVTLAAGFTETYIGQLVKFTGVKFVTGGTFAALTNYVIEKSGVKKEIRINTGTDLVGKNIPTDNITITGIMVHYINKQGTVNIYQLYPRTMGDIVLGAGPNINSILTQTYIHTTDFKVSYTTQRSGTTMFKYGITKSLEMGTLQDTIQDTLHSKVINGLNPATFYYVQALSADTNQDTSRSTINYFSTASLSSGKMTVYFNNSVDTSYARGTVAITLNQTVDDTLVAYINRAKQSIDMAIYNLNNTNLSANISDALNNAATRGVLVRVVYNGDGSTANIGIATLSTSVKKLASPQGSSYTIMHNKFLVFDAKSTNPEDAIVWTGSTNLTEDQIHSDFNNVIIIHDQALAKAYVLEFEEMWGSNGTDPNSSLAKFGPFKTDNTPHYFNIGGSLVELYFSPSDQVTQKIINAVNSADKSIYFATYSFTRTEIAYPMIDKFNAGVYVAGMIGDIGGTSSGAYDVLHPVLNNNVLAYPASGGKLFHHKYAVIDQGDSWHDPIVITGSHNWSGVANTTNDENTLMVHNFDIATQYMQEWAKRFAEKGGNVVVGVDKNKKDYSGVVKYFILNDLLYLEYNSTKHQTASIRLFDLSGKMILNKEVKLTEGQNSLLFNASMVPASIYILQIFDGTQNRSIKLFAK